MDKEKGKNETQFQPAEQLREGQELNHVVLTSEKSNSGKEDWCGVEMLGKLHGGGTCSQTPPLYLLLPL